MLISCQHEFKETIVANDGIKFKGYNSVQRMPYLGGSTGEITWDQVKYKPTLFPPEAHVHDYKPLAWVPTWLEVAGKPNFAAVTFTGQYSDLLGKPILFDGKYSSLTEIPNFSEVALTGSYNDLIDKPFVFPPMFHQHDSTTWDSIKAKPPLRDLNTALKALKIIKPPKHTTTEIDSWEVEEGDLTYDKTLHAYKYWNGSSWKIL